VGTPEAATKAPQHKPAARRHHHASKHKTAAAKEAPAPQAAQQK
jgi:hypothetical protein